MLGRAIEMRSSHHVPGANLYKGANLAKDSPVGYAFVEGFATTILVIDTLLVASSMPAALLAARNHPFRGLKLVVPAGPGQYFVYSTKLALAFEVGTPGFMPPFQFKTGFKAERYIFNSPGVAPIYPDSYSQTQPVGGEAEKTERGSVLFAALSEAQNDPKAILGLDLDVLAEADTASRKEIFRIILDKGIDLPGGFDLLARVILTTPSGEFAEFEKQIITPAMVNRMAYKKGTGRALLGRAYTMKALELRPLGAAALDSLPVYHIGHEGSTKWWVDVFPEEVQSQAVAPEDWFPQDPTTIGKEPALPGQQPGPITQTGLRFRETSHYTPWYGFGASTESTDKSQVYHPTQLLRVQIKGTPEELIVSAFELAMIGPVTDPWREIFLPGVMKIVNLWMIYAGARGFIGGMGAASMMTRGLAGADLAAAETAAQQLMSQTIRRFLFDVLVLGGSTAVNEYREELQKTALGRAFVTLCDIALLGLTARDVYRLFSSGVLTRLITSAAKAIEEMGAAAPQRLLEMYDSWRAFATAMEKTVKDGLVKVAKTTTGHSFTVPTNEPGFLAMFRSTRAELAGARVMGGLQAAGRPTKVAEEVFGRLKTLAAETEEFAQAYSAVARRAARLAPGDVNLFLNRVSAVLNTRRAIAGKLGGFLRYAARADDALAALAQAEQLAARAGMSDEAIMVLAKKAGDNTVDIAWLNDLDLTLPRLDFMARDPNCPWRLFKRAAENPFDTAAQDAAAKALRGYGGEMLAEELIPKLLPRFTIAGRQAAMRTSVIDFLLGAPGRTRVTHGLEVKAWSKEIWDDIGTTLYKRRVSHKAMTDSEAMVVEWFDGLSGQLENAKKASKGAEPFLMIPKSASQKTVDEMMHHFRSKGVDPEILQFDETALNAIIRELATGLSIGP